MKDPKKFDSITDFLVAHGFHPTEKGFTKAGVLIPPEELQKHSVATFAEKASRKGWLDMEDSPYPLPYNPYGGLVLLSLQEDPCLEKGYPAMLEEFYWFHGGTDCM
jgi:hypothetical protein